MRRRGHSFSDRGCAGDTRDADPSEQPEDFAGISAVIRLAFGQEAEARLVTELRQLVSFDPLLSLVAVQDHKVVGYILFTPIAIRRDDTAPVPPGGCRRWQFCRGISVQASDRV